MSNIKVSIQLDPEFGWTTTSTPVYGPGSVLQGIVHVQNASNEQVDRLRILFHGSESLIAIPNNSCSVDGRYYREQFFGSQRILWNQKSGSAMEDTMQFPFTIQLPLVQFPPSIEMPNFYACRFQLVSYLEGANETLLAQDSCPVTFVPQIETRISKESSGRPFSLEAMDKQQKKFKVQLDALDYLPGDVIQPLIYQPPAYRVRMRLFQVFTIRTSDGSKKYKRPVAEVVGSPLLDVPEDLVPSFGYGRVVSVSYELRVSFLKPAGDSTFATLLSLKSSHAVVTLRDIPVRIGTLGYGIRASDELQVYTAFKSIFGKGEQSTAPSLPAPRYVSSVEYKDALPLYEDYHLPVYQA